MAVDRLDAGRAIENGEFVPHFQPLVNLRTRQLQGFELLARWNHPQRGWIPPDEFIPLAEKDGWIHLLTAELLRKGLSAIAALPGMPMLSVNISTLQLHDLSLPRQIEAKAKKAGFALERLIVEITESALTHDVDSARTTVNALKEVGCKLALDDFGTGYSSLLHLQSMPFDELKIDRSFVGSMTQQRDSRKIVAAVVGLGQSLGLTTVAEGIETQEQAEMLLWLGCELGQGWLYGRPVPAAQLAEVVSDYEQKRVASPPGDVIGRASRSSLDSLPSQRLAQLQAVYDGAPVGLAFLDRNLRYMNLNRRLANMNGRPIEEHLGRTVAEMIPELYPQVEPFIRRALAGEAIPGIEITKPATGPNTEKTILLSYEPARDEAGEVVGVSVALVDLTPVKRAEEARHETEQHFRHMMELMPQIPWVIDREGRALDVSQRWLEITGTTGEQWRGFGWLEALHPDDVQPTQDAMQRAFTSGLPIDARYRVRRSEAHPWKWVRARGSARRDADGTIIGWYGSLEGFDENPQPPPQSA
jgi:PAS domain S-box-containing protein